MKKCKFFSVLLVALFVLIGVDSNAQSYKSISEAKILVNTVTLEASNAQNGASESVTAPSTVGTDQVFRIRIGKSLLKHLNNGVEVVSALNAVTTEFSSFTTGGKAAAKNAVLLMYNELLKN